jgi:hypothetical protein
LQSLFLASLLLFLINEKSFGILIRIILLEIKYPSRQNFSKTRLNAQKGTKKSRKVGVFEWQLGFPTVSETRLFFSIFRPCLCA